VQVIAADGRAQALLPTAGGRLWPSLSALKVRLRGCGVRRILLLERQTHDEIIGRPSLHAADPGMPMPLQAVFALAGALVVRPLMLSRHARRCARRHSAASMGSGSAALLQVAKAWAKYRDGVRHLYRCFETAASRFSVDVALPVLAALACVWVR
jgi:hypothetical protein